MRSVLYVPADRATMLERALSSPADAIVMDLEDSVAADRKRVALQNATEIAADRKGPNAPELWIRINGGQPGLRELDTVLSSCSPAGVWLPKAEAASPYTEAAVASLSAFPDVGIGLIVETAAGVDSLPSLLAAVPNDRTRVGIGEEDLRADLRIPRPADASILGALRAHLVVGAALHKMARPVGPAWTDLQDSDGFRRSCRQLRHQGFGGRGCIHPGQLAIANAEFAPSESELRAAADLVAEYEVNVRAGRGVFRDSRGHMADEATVKQARYLLGGDGAQNG